MPSPVRIVLVWTLLCAAAPPASGQDSGQPLEFDPAAGVRPLDVDPTAGSLALPSPVDKSLAGPQGQRGVRDRSATVSGSLPSLVTVLGSLSVVLGLFFLFAWLLKRGSNKSSTSLPADVVEVLGRAPLAARQYVHLVRLGSKLLLVSISPGGAETLAELTDPVEVDRLVGLCKQTHPDSSTNAFRQVFQQFAGQRTSGFLESGLGAGKAGIDRAHEEADA